MNFSEAYCQNSEDIEISNFESVNSKAAAVRNIIQVCRSLFEVAQKYENAEGILFVGAELEELVGRISTQLSLISNGRRQDRELIGRVLVIDNEMFSVQEQSKGVVPFKGQHILFELLNLLAEHEGASVSKEAIVRKIWNESYDPRTHDNRVYVTVRRLRNLIEPDRKTSRYILRTRDGYSLRQAVRIVKSDVA